MPQAVFPSLDILADGDLVAVLVDTGGGRLEQRWVSWAVLQRLAMGIDSFRLDSAAGQLVVRLSDGSETGLGWITQDRETVDQVSPSGALLATDVFPVGRGAELLQATPDQVVTLLAPRVLAWLNAQAVPGTPPAITINRPAATALGSAVALSGIISDPLGGGIEVSTGGAFSGIALTIAGTQWTASLPGLVAGWWNITARLAAYPERQNDSDWFPVGSPGTLLLTPDAAPLPGTQLRLTGYVGTGTTYVAWSIPILSANEAPLYSSAANPLLARDAFIANSLVPVPARAGAYQVAAQNPADGSTGFVTITVPAPTAPTLWVAPQATADRMSAGITFRGQWGFSLPSGLEWRLSSSAGLGAWQTASGATLALDGSWTWAMPPQSGLTAGAYTSIQFRRADAQGVRTPLYFSVLT